MNRGRVQLAMALSASLALAGCAWLPSKSGYLVVRPMPGASGFVEFNESEFRADEALGYLEAGLDQAWTTWDPSKVAVPQGVVGQVFEEIEHKWVQKYNARPVSGAAVYYRNSTFRVMAMG